MRDRTIPFIPGVIGALLWFWACWSVVERLGFLMHKIFD